MKIVEEFDPKFMSVGIKFKLIWLKGFRGVARIFSNDASISLEVWNFLIYF